MTAWIASAPIMFTPEFLLGALVVLGLPFLGMILGAVIRAPVFVAFFTVPIFLAAVFFLGASIVAGPPTAEEYAVNPDVGGDRRMAQSLGVFLLMASGFGAMCFGIAWTGKHEARTPDASKSDSEKWE